MSGRRSSRGSTERREAAVADAGPLIHLDELGALALVDTYRRVWVPGVVMRELDRHRSRWRSRMPPVIRVASPSTGEVAAIRARLAEPLDAGETAALAVWSRHPEATVLCDDLAARRAAVALGAPVLGTLGIVLRAVRCGRIAVDEAAALLAAVPAATSMHVRRDLIQRALAYLRDVDGPAEVRDRAVRHGAVPLRGARAVRGPDPKAKAGPRRAVPPRRPGTRKRGAAKPPPKPKRTR